MLFLESLPKSASSRQTQHVCVHVADINNHKGVLSGTKSDYVIQFWFGLPIKITISYPNKILYTSLHICDARGHDFSCKWGEMAESSPCTLLS